MVPDAVLAAHQNQLQLARAPQPTLCTPPEILAKPQAGLTLRAQQEARHRQPWRPSSTSVSVLQASSSQAPSRRQSMSMQASASGNGLVARHHASRRSSLGTLHAANSHAAVLNAKLAAGEPLDMLESYSGKQLSSQDTLLDRPSTISPSGGILHAWPGTDKGADEKQAVHSAAAPMRGSGSLIPAYRPAVAANQPTGRTQAERDASTHFQNVNDWMGGRPREVLEAGTNTSPAAAPPAEPGSKRISVGAATDDSGHSTAQLTHGRSSRVAARSKPLTSRSPARDSWQLDMNKNIRERSATSDGMQPSNGFARGTGMASLPQGRHAQPKSPCKRKQTPPCDAVKKIVRESMGESRPVTEAASMQRHGARNAAGRTSYAARWMSSLDAAMRSLDVAADRTSHALQSRLAPAANPPRRQQLSADVRHVHPSASAASSVTPAQADAGQPEEHAGPRNDNISIQPILPAASAAASRRQHAMAGSSEVRVANASSGASLGIASEAGASEAGSSQGARSQQQQQQSAHPDRIERDGRPVPREASAQAQGHQQQQHQGRAHRPRGDAVGLSGASSDQGHPVQRQQKVTHQHHAKGQDRNPVGDVDRPDRKLEGMVPLPSDSPLLEAHAPGHEQYAGQQQTALLAQQAALNGSPSKHLNRSPTGQRFSLYPYPLPHPRAQCFCSTRAHTFLVH